MKKLTSLQRKWIKRIFEKWRGRLLLHEYYVDIKYMSANDDDDDFIRFASITTCPVYLNTIIRIYPRFWEQSKDQQERTIVHELCHCLTQEAWDTVTHIQNGHVVNKKSVKDIMERLTQRISNCIFMGYE